MMDRELLMGAFDRLPKVVVRGPDRRGRVRVGYVGDGFMDLGPVGCVAADAALEWRARWRPARSAQAVGGSQ